MHGNTVDDTEQGNDCARGMMKHCFIYDKQRNGAISGAEKLVEHSRYILENISGINFACGIAINNNGKAVISTDVLNENHLCHSVTRN